LTWGPKALYNYCKKGRGRNCSDHKIVLQPNIEKKNKAQGGGGEELQDDVPREKNREGSTGKRSHINVST